MSSLINNFLIFFFIASVTVSEGQTQTCEPGTLVCSDGTQVTRSGPDCKFKCPVPNTNTTSTTPNILRNPSSAPSIANQPVSASATQPSQAQPSQQPNAPAQPSQAQPSQAQPSQAQPSQAQPSQAQPSQAQPSQAQPSQVQPSQAQPSQAQPSQKPSEPAKLPNNASSASINQLKYKWNDITDRNSVHVVNSTNAAFKSWNSTNACSSLNVNVTKAQYTNGTNKEIVYNVVADVSCKGTGSARDFSGRFVVHVNHTKDGFFVIECGRVLIQSNKTEVENWLAMFNGTTNCESPSQRISVFNELGKESANSENKGSFIGQVMEDFDAKTLAYVGSAAIAFVLLVVVVAIALSRKNNSASNRPVLSAADDSETDAEDSSTEMLDKDSGDTNSVGTTSDVESDIETNALMKTKNTSSKQEDVDLEEGSFMNSPCVKISKDD